MTKLGRDIVVNVLFAVINLGCLWLLTRLSTGTLLPAALAVFMLVRRYSASFVCMICLGAPTFQIRYMAMHADDANLGQLVNVVVVVVYAAVTALVLAALAIGARSVRGALFPTASYPPWVLWYVVVLSIQALFHFVVIDNLLVERRMVLYNVYRLLPSSVFYVCALMLAPDGSAQRVLWWGIVAGFGLLAVGLGLYAIRIVLNFRRLPLGRTGWLLKELLVYGPPRSMINLADSLLFVVGPWLIRDQVDEIAYLLTMFVFVQATSIIVLPVNELSMVVGANRVGRDDTSELEAGTRQLFETMLVMSLIVVAMIYPYRDALFRLMIPRTAILAGVERYSLLLSSIVPLTVYNALKGVIEMRWKAPRNLANLSASLAAGVVSFHLLERGGWGASDAVRWACLTTFWGLGLLTVVSAWSLVRRAAWRPLAVMALLCAAVLTGNVSLMTFVLRGPVPVVVQLLLAAGNGVALVVLWWYTSKPLLLQTALGAVRRWVAPRAVAGSS
jgi:hypothetical protein